MSNNNVKATAPYNFIPFSNKVLEYDGMLPEHGKIYKGLKSGEIHIKVTADTDLMIAGRKDADNVCRFYKNNDGKFAIPGSSLRGLIRRNMQILGFGYFDINEHFEDYQIFYRAIVSKGRNLKKRNEKNEDDKKKDYLNKYYKSMLGVKTGNKNGKSFSNPENVKAGYIKKENGGYVIYPAKDGYIRINRNSEILDKFKPAKSDDEYARVVSVLYKGSDDKNLVLKSDRDADSDALRNGKLLYTGKSVENKPNAVYLFTEGDENSAENA